MQCRRTFSELSCFLLVCVVTMGANQSSGQELICHAEPDSIDALLELDRMAPYESGAVLPAMRIALHVLHESDGSGGYGESAIDSLLAGLAVDFASTGIMFVPVERNDINSSQLFHSLIDSAGVLFSTYADSTRIDVFLGEASGAIEGTTAGIPSTALALTGSACTTSALSHFMSHCLGLYDTDETAFGVESEYGGNSASAGDLVTDTAKVAPSTNIMKEPDVGSWAEFTAEQGRRMSAAVLALPELRRATYTSGVVYRDGSGATSLENLYTGKPTNATAVDLNADGALDLVLAASRSAFVAVDYHPAMKVPEFDDRTLTAFSGGTDAFVRDAAGIIAADYDNDGDLDLYLPGTAGHRLLRNNGSGAFTDAPALPGSTAPRRPRTRQSRGPGATMTPMGRLICSSWSRVPRWTAVHQHACCGTPTGARLSRQPHRGFPALGASPRCGPTSMRTTGWILSWCRPVRTVKGAEIPIMEGCRATSSTMEMVRSPM